VTTRTLGGLAALAALASACASPRAAPRELPEPLYAAAPAATAQRDEEDDEEIEDDHASAERIADVLQRVASARGLPVRREVRGRVVERPEMLEQVRARIEAETPRDLLRLQGEALTALELVPPTYDVPDGLYRLLEGQVAGFYDQTREVLFLAEDLDRAEAFETLAHELAHALQDQAYSLDALLAYAPGQGDRLAAVHALAEGDATSASFDVAMGSAFRVSEGLLRKMIAATTAFSTAGAATPRFLQASLTAPYADGFACVQRLRREGGWPAVDRVWAAPPETTEQLLHADKLAAREPALAVAPPRLEALGPGWTADYVDVMGELGLRTVFEDWTSGALAEAAAAGWGGDSFLVARRAGPAPGDESFAVAWRVRFDTPRDAAEARAVLERRWGTTCRERADRGPLTWASARDEVALVAGPLTRRGATRTSAASCADATRWVADLLRP
jgi:hypothetical protein